MKEFLDFVVRHGAWMVFAWVFLEQAGLPIPSAPLLLAAGALAGTHQMNLPVVMLLAVLAALMADGMWFVLGRQKGVRVVQFLCRIALEPDTCVRRTQTSFGKSGARFLLVAKFIPGLNAMAAPLAGIIRMSVRRFVMFDALGAIFWVSSFMLTGYVFSSELELVAASAAHLGEWLFLCLLAGFGSYIGWKYYKRQKFLEQIRIDRISPEDLKAKMDAGEEMIVVDLRHEMDFELQPLTIPGAIHMDAAEIEEAAEVIPRDREIILFCACPNEATAARLALLLRSKGITRIRPLAEGYEGWRSRGYPMGVPKSESDEPSDEPGPVPA